MTSPTTVPRVLLALLAVSVVIALAIGVVSIHRRAGPRAVAATDVAPAGAAGSYAAGVLHRWDAERGAAWADGEPDALRALYTPRSAAGAADVRMLSRWRSRGLRVTGIDMVVLRLVVVARSPRRLVLVVTDQEVGATARGRGTATVLPRDLPTAHRVELRRATGGPWRVASVT